MKLGDNVKILSVNAFNERFVKVGDIATIVGISKYSIVLHNLSWDTYQFTGLYGEGYDWEYCH